MVINKDKSMIKIYVEDVWLANHKEIEIVWFYQPLPQKVGDTLLCVREWVVEKPTAVLYPECNLF